MVNKEDIKNFIALGVVKVPEASLEKDRVTHEEAKKNTPKTNPIKSMLTGMTMSQSPYVHRKW